MSNGQYLCTPSPNDYRNDYNSPKLIAPNGEYRGNINSNQYDYNSISNPYGRYGNPYSHESVNNPYSDINTMVVIPSH